MRNPINSLRGIKVCRPYYRTVVVDVDDENNQLFREVLFSDSAPDYEDMKLDSLIKAGIDPASVNVSSDVSNRIENFDTLNNIANLIKD